MWEREISVLLPGRDQTLFCSQLKKHSLTLSPLHNIQKMLFFHSDLKNSMFEVVPRKSTFYILKNVQFNGGPTQTWPHHPVRATAAPSRAQAVVHVCDDLHEPVRVQQGLEEQRHARKQPALRPQQRVFVCRPGWRMSGDWVKWVPNSCQVCSATPTPGRETRTLQFSDHLVIVCYGFLLICA